jgi:excinuclease ABC subunit B
MGIATWHEFKPASSPSPRARGEGRGEGQSSHERPRKPSLDEMGPGVESIPGGKRPDGPRSTLGRPGMRGGFKPRRR